MRVKLGPNVTDARGKLGDIVHSIWKKGTHYVRSLAGEYSDPESELQLLMRSCKSEAYDAWSALSEAIKALWEEFAKQFDHRNQDLNQGGGTTNLIPHHRPPITGQMAFVQAYLRLCRARTKTHDIPATTGQPCCLEDLTAEASYEADYIEVNWSEPSTCDYIGTVYLNENFDDEILNAIPPAWTPPWIYFQAGTSFIKVNNTFAHSGTKAVQVAAGSATSSARFPIAALATQESIVIEHQILATLQSGSQNCLWTTDSPPTAVQVRVRMHLGVFKYYDGVVETNGPAFVAEVWYHLKYVLHPASRTWDLYINDMCNPIATGLDYFTNTDAGTVYIQTDTTDSWLDDVHVYYSNQYVRAWLLSYAGGAHKQIVCQVPALLGGMAITKARFAAGVLQSLDIHPGVYYLQFDVLGIDELQNGLLSVPSRIFKVIIL